MKYIVLDIETTGLNSIDNKITCICAKFKHESFEKSYKRSCSNEGEIIRGLLDYLEWVFLFSQEEKIPIVTKNGKMFDIPMIVCRNSFIEKPKNVNWKLFYNSFTHIDLQESTKGRVRLDDMATLMNFNNKSANGMKAIEWFNKGKYGKIVKYCWNDVLLTEKVFLKLKKNKRL